MLIDLVDNSLRPEESSEINTFVDHIAHLFSYILYF